MRYPDRCSAEPAEQSSDPPFVARSRERLQYPGEDYRNVVIAAVVFCRLDQVVRGERQIDLELAYDQLDIGVLHEVVEAIGTEQVYVAGGRFVLAQMGANAFLDAERSGHQAAVVRLPRVRSRDESPLYLIAQQGIVGREQLQRVVSQPIDSRVTDVSERNAVVVKQHQRE